MRGRLVLAMWIGLSATAARAPARAADAGGGTEPDWKKGTVDVIGLLAQGKVDDVCAYFDDDVRKALPASTLAKVWQATQDQAGAFQDLGTPTLTLVNGLHVVDVPARFQWTPLTIRVAWNAEGAIAGLRILPAGSGEPSAGGAGAPPAPASPPAGIREIEVTVGQDPWKLPGTLALPDAGAASPPYPAVVLLHGSGPNDRDETIGPNRPFREITQGLAARGIAVLRYDKRTRVYRMKMNATTITVEDEALDDAYAAIDLLRGRSEIDPKRIFLVGHSLGGVLAPLVAQARPDLAGIAMLAATARPLTRVLVSQLDYIASIAADSASKAETARLRELAASAEDPATPDSVMVLGMPVRYLRDLARRDPAAAAARLTLPVLVLQGGRDYQATMEDFALWKKALAGDPRASFIAYPNLNHLFQAGEGTATPQEYGKAAPVAPEVIRDLASWVLGK